MTRRDLSYLCPAAMQAPSRVWTSGNTHTDRAFTRIPDAPASRDALELRCGSLRLRAGAEQKRHAYRNPGRSLSLA